MLDPSKLFDLNIGCALSHRRFIRNGDAWVGITAKPIAVAALEAFDPARQRSLAFANPLPLTDPRNCTTIQAVVDPPALRSRSTEDGLIWTSTARLAPGSGAARSRARSWADASAAAGAWSSTPPASAIRRPAATSSTTSTRSTREWLADDGKPIRDRYIVGVAGDGFVGAVPMNQCEPAPPVTDPRRQIQDVGVPVMRIMSQSDYAAQHRLAAARRRHTCRSLPPLRDGGTGHATSDEIY
jgi:Alpha/beta hydrolase domain